MSRVLLVSTDVVGAAMAGPGIRALELARVLAARHEVTLAAPGPVDLEGLPFALAAYEPGRAGALTPLIERAEVLVAQGFVLEMQPELLAARLPLAIDLYDPLVLEALDLYAEGEPALAEAQHTRYLSLTAAMLRRGDFFFCATERQRDYWLGALTVANRITPTLARNSDRELRSLIDLVPSGLPVEPPAREASVLRGVHPAIGEEALLLVWAGGLWDWFDPLTPIRAVAAVANELPQLRLCFFAGARPNPHGAPFRPRGVEQARALAAELGVLDRAVLFLDSWLPYAERGRYLAEADGGISAHRPGIETRFAFRTRLLDYLWARLPLLCTEGDSLGAEIVAGGAGLALPAGDAQSWAAALRRFAHDERLRTSQREAADAIARRYLWEVTARPLEAFCAAPRRTGSDGSPEAARIAELEAALEERLRYVRHVEQQYRAATAGSAGRGWIGRLLGRLRRRG